MVTVAQLILILMGPVRDPALAFRLADMVTREARAANVDPRLVVAVMRNESGFRLNAIGSAGELGLMQLKRGTKATAGREHLTDAELMAPALNIRLGVRHLARKRRICGGEPERWLSAYSGRDCGPSGYSRRVLARLEGAL